MQHVRLPTYSQIILDQAWINSFILANSVIPAFFQGEPPLDGWVLGDNGYPLKTWLITPYIMPTTVSEVFFNRKHVKARTVIERMFGILKMCFRCLDKTGGTLQYSPQKIGAFFVACCVLHNVAIRHGFLSALNENRLQDFLRREAEMHVPMAINPVDGPPPVATCCFLLAASFCFPVF